MRLPLQILAGLMAVLLVAGLLQEVLEGRGRIRELEARRDSVLTEVEVVRARSDSLEFVATEQARRIEEADRVAGARATEADAAARRATEAVERAVGVGVDIGDSLLAALRSLSPPLSERFSEYVAIRDEEAGALRSQVEALERLNESRVLQLGDRDLLIATYRDEINLLRAEADGLRSALTIQQDIAEELRRKAYPSFGRLLQRDAPKIFAAVAVGVAAGVVIAQ